MAVVERVVAAAGVVGAVVEGLRSLFDPLVAVREAEAVSAVLLQVERR